MNDPDRFVFAVNAAAEAHGISRPVVEASAWTVRATKPAEHARAAAERGAV